MEFDRFRVRTRTAPSSIDALLLAFRLSSACCPVTVHPELVGDASYSVWISFTCRNTELCVPAPASSPNSMLLTESVSLLQVESSGMLSVSEHWDETDVATLSLEEGFATRTPPPITRHDTEGESFVPGLGGS